MKNRIYFFTGTGNSLKAAKDIANAIGDCEILAICKGADVNVPSECETVGFVLPVYFFGLPKMAAEFLRNIQLENAKYLFVIATPGGISGKPLAQAEKIFSEKGLHFNYGKKIRMNANYIIRYGLIKIFYTTAMKTYDKRIAAIISDVKSRKNNAIEKFSQRFENIYLDNIRGVHDTDKGYNVSEACISCGICKNVCPAKNITMDGGRPVFHNQCESCMACIQYCPKEAINWSDKTQKRKRYTHPEIKYTELSKYYNFEK